jgi:hypothetical protein
MLRSSLDFGRRVRLIFWLIDEECLSIMDLREMVAFKSSELAPLGKILRVSIYSQIRSSAYITTPDFSLKKMLKMKQAEVDDCCELGVKGSCVTCDFRAYCKGKWSHRTGQGAGAGADLKIS